MLRLSQGPRYCLLTLIVGIVLAILAVAISAASSATASAPAAYNILYVAPGADCGGVLPCYSTLQAAVDAAGRNGDTIKVAAGIYTDVHSRPAPPGYIGSAVITQVAYISKVVTIQGGYVITNWSIPDPEANLTTLDARGQGRVLYVTGGDSSITGLHITGGNAMGLGGNQGADCGGGVYVGNFAEFVSNHIFSNTAVYGGGLCQASYYICFNGNVVSSNSATQAGGGIFAGNGNLSFSHNTVMSNTAGEGGGVYIGNGIVKITGNTLSGNRATVAGGGLYLNNIHGDEIQDNLIVANQATNNGGGVNLEHGSVSISGNVISGNDASQGGGLYLYQSNVTFSGNQVNNNVSGFSGGGLRAYSSLVTMTNNTIFANASQSGNGGGASLAWGDGSIVSNTIAHNTASGGGGLMLNSAHFTLSNNLVVSNSTIHPSVNGYGGGVGLHYVDAVLDNNVFSGNIAIREGGGLSLYHSNVTFNQNRLIANTARDGGGLSTEDYSQVTMNDNLVSGNTARDYGGGLLLGRTEAVLNNNVILSNAAQYGGGLLVVNSSAQLQHTTIARNKGESGSGMCVITSLDGKNSSVALTNTILVSHTVGISVTSGNTVTLNGVLWYSNTANIDGGGTVTVTRAISGNPAFAADGYHLLAGSAAIDQGVSTDVATDIDGRHRPQGAAPDLGADEFPGIGLVISKSGPAWALPGAPITYWLTIQNRGDVDITETLAVTDRVPVGAHPVGYPPQSVITWTCPPTSPIVWPPCDPPYCYQAWSVRFVVTATETIINSDYGARTGGLAVRGEPIVVTRILNQRAYLPLVLRGQ